jgi:hypothetical protein
VCQCFPPDTWKNLCLHVHHSLSLLGNGSLNTFPRHWRVVECVVFYAIRVVSKESRRLVLPRTSCFLRYPFQFSLFSSIFFIQWENSEFCLYISVSYSVFLCQPSQILRISFKLPVLSPSPQSPQSSVQDHITTCHDFAIRQQCVFSRPRVLQCDHVIMNVIRWAKVKIPLCLLT